MNDMDEKFYIDDHAVLAACLIKAAVVRLGNRGREAAVRAIASYGREWGLRMAMRCVADGEPLSALNYFLYGEWIDPRGWSKSEIASYSPHLVTHMTMCGWYDSWKKHDLMEWGAVYCDWGDENLLHGFNPELSLRMGDLMSRTGRTCVFNWLSCTFKDEAEASAAFARRAELAPRVTKSFLYHCAHMLSAFRREYLTSFGLIEGGEVISSALGLYAEKLGGDKVPQLEDASRANFLEV